MRRRHRFARVGLALFLIPVFLSTALLYGVAPADAAPAKSSPPTQQPAPSQSATISGTDPLGVPEDPLGRQSEQQAPEISISVDVRDGHLIVRVVDVWGPGRVPLVMRSWTGVGNSRPEQASGSSIIISMCRVRVPALPFSNRTVIKESTNPPAGIATRPRPSAGTPM